MGGKSMPGQVVVLKHLEKKNRSLKRWHLTEQRACQLGIVKQHIFAFKATITNIFFTRDKI